MCKRQLPILSLLLVFLPMFWLVLPPSTLDARARDLGDQPEPAAAILGGARLTATDGLVPLTGIRQVAVGNPNTCALTTAGGVKCWGSGYGPIPISVNGLTSGVAAITAGESHACALTTAGGVKCWGANWDGQLGDGTTTSRTTPVDVSGLTSGVTAVSAGKYFTCAVIAAGGVKCWGWNHDGQLGDGTTTNRTVPVAVSGLAGASAVTAGGYHTCALTTAGGVKCWGRNGGGQLGDGTTTQRLMPADVMGLTGISVVVAGDSHTCALTPTGGVKCWGDNWNGELGIGTRGYWRTTPVDVNGLTSGASAIAVGAHTCAVVAGGVKCWGANWYGQLGDGTTTDQPLPTDVSGLASGMTAIAASYTDTCALTTTGGVKCWGSNDYGQLGDGTIARRTVPTDVSGLTGSARAIAAGDQHSCAVTSTGSAKCWGYGWGGQLGDGASTSRSAPVDVSGVTGISTLAAGGDHTCALTASGGVKCWGDNWAGQLGDGTRNERTTPVDVSGLGTGVVSVSAGRVHTCALTTSGGIKCWGWVNNALTPQDVSGLTSGVAAVVAGNDYTCVLTTAGGAKCWGVNSQGQLGDGTTMKRTVPVDVSGLTSGVMAIAAGGSHTCALTVAKGVKCWGANYAGQLGDNTTTNRTVPVDVSGLTGVSAIDVGGYHTCALITGGGVKCWGSNSYGQLGDDTTISRAIPADVSGLTGVDAIDVGVNHTCALITGGGVKCWGDNDSGQVGDGSRQFTATDVMMLPSVLYLPLISR